MPNEILKGTTIITWLEVDKIVIAADSKQAWGDSSNTNLTPLKCKIRHVDNFFFAAEGHVQMITPPIDYLDIIENMEVDSNISFNDRVEFITSSLEEPVDLFMQTLQQTHNSNFNLLNNKYFMSLVFCSFEEHLPVCATVSWQLIINSGGWEIRTTSLKPPRIPTVIKMGQISTLSIIPGLESEMNNEDLRVRINSLMEQQTESTPNDVGPPYDIVIIRNEGYEWLQKKDECN